MRALPVGAVVGCDGSSAFVGYAAGLWMGGLVVNGGRRSGRTHGRFVLGVVFAAIGIGLFAQGCGVEADAAPTAVIPTPTPQLLSVAGFVAGVEPTTGQAQRILVLDQAGTTWTFVIEFEPGWKVPAEHLMEHERRRLPVVVYYRDEADGARTAVRIEDG
jgi:hypothetical protein